jgi:probable lipoprotein NlpC
MKLFSLAMIALFTAGFGQGLLFAAPLESGFALAPRASASRQERTRAYSEARLKVIEAAKKYEGVPYVYGGMTPRGLDCSGFICLSFRDAIGVTLPRSAAGLYSWAERVSLERAQPGDLLFFITGSTRAVTHVGLYLGNRRFIHSASAGASTGVIYSSLDEPYWARTFASAGRAFPDTPGFSINDNTSIASGNSGTVDSGAGSSSANRRESSSANRRENSSANRQDNTRSNTSFDNSRLVIGAAIAPTFNTIKDNGVFRGFTSQLCFGVDTTIFGLFLGLGLELRPEYDGALGVFRLPFTMSLGIGNNFRIFAGPVLSIGEASITIDEEERLYSGGTSWLGNVGVTFEIFNIKINNSEFAPYLEAAWQSYSAEDLNFFNPADFSACFRLSTGIRWRMKIR